MSEPAWLRDWPGARAGEPMARHSQYGIGGPADWFVQVRTIHELGDLVRQCRAGDLPVTVVGAGSNTLVLDGGIRGVVIELTGKSLDVVDDTTIELSAAFMMPRAALDCARMGLAGMEFGIGVPGTCGASVRGNAGAFGSEIKDVLVSCAVMTADGDLRTFANATCEFAYRTSIFKARRHGDIITSARFSVHQDDPAAVRARTDAIQQERKDSQPYGIRSLGSVFTNPPGDHAARLIDAAGLKGTRCGGAEISTKHANFIVNIGNASADDVLTLVNRAHRVVLERFGVDLEREIVVIGEDAAVRRGRG